MIILLYQAGCAGHARRVAKDLRRAFKRHISVRVRDATKSGGWPAEESWDDLLVLLFDGSPLTTPGLNFITQYLARHTRRALLPVSISKKHPIPPGPASTYKALPYEAGTMGKDGTLVRRIGAMLSLRLQGRDTKIFLSHRASDGARIAAQLCAHLQTLGYKPFLDEAKEGDGYTRILPGTEAQKEIDAAVAEASLVLLLDTPNAPASVWIKHEVDTADGMLVPILPIHFYISGDSRRGPRFPSLLGLQRWEDMPMPPPCANPLTALQVDQITTAAERYLCEILQRKCRVPFIVRKEFEARGFTWTVVDPKLLFYKSSKGDVRFRVNVFNHCSMFENIYAPALNVFRKYAAQHRWAQHALFIYDSNQLLPDSVLSTLVHADDDDDPVRVLHHQELPRLLASNFTTVSPL